MALEGEDDLDFITPGEPASEEGGESEADGLENDPNAELSEAEGDIDEDDPEQVDDADEEFEEVEHSGKKYKVHKDLKPALMMHADYTRKTQEVAETRRALESHFEAVRAQEQALAQQAEAQRQNLREHAHLFALDQRIEQYNKLDWAKLEQEDPLTAQSRWREKQQLQEQRNGLAWKLHQSELQAQQEQQHKALAAQQELAKRIEEGQRVLQRDIKGWNAETAAKVTDFAKANGFTDEEVSSITDPRYVKVLHKAWLADQLIAKQKAAAKPQTQQTKPLTPIVKGKTAPAMSGLDDRLAADEWVRRRNEQVRRRA